MTSIKLILLFTIGVSATTHASTCLESPKGARPHLTVRWPDRAVEVGNIALKIDLQSKATELSCGDGQPIICTIDGDLGSFTLSRAKDGVSLIIRGGHLALTKDDGQKLRPQVVRDTPDTVYPLEVREPATCLKRFGPAVTLTFP